MKKYITIAISAVSLITLVGCTGCSMLRVPETPANEISFNPKTGELHVKSHKQIKLDSGSVRYNPTNNCFELYLTNFQSINDPAIVQSLMQLQTAQVKSAADTTKSITDLLQQFGQKIP